MILFKFAKRGSMKISWAFALFTSTILRNSDVPLAM